MHRRRRALIGCLAIATLASVVCRPAPGPEAEWLDTAWDAYKRTYLHHDGYVVDPGRGEGEVTSEGQGYALLRAAWMGDAPTFARVFEWTEQHLRRADGLYSWRWSPVGGGRVLDANTATDADQEIALALILASSAFDQADWLTRARELLTAIRRHASVETPGGWFPSAGNWAVADRIVNLSYFLPYAYPAFATIDPASRWEEATRTGYDLMARVLAIPGVRLIPDFMRVNEDGAASLLAAHAGVSGDFTSDAMRVYWRVALDCHLHQRTQACADPLNVRTLTQLLARDGRLFTHYTTGGMPLDTTESVSFSAMALPFLLLHAPAAAGAVRAERLTPSVLDEVATNRDRYYDANWVWFGLAAAEDIERGDAHRLWIARARGGDSNP